MGNEIVFLAFILLTTVSLIDAKGGLPKLEQILRQAINMSRVVAKYDNPNFIRDRYKEEINKPMQNQDWERRFRMKFHPSWMDYCDPSHCNDYHKRACGLNRASTKFKWFQSGCHIVLHNFCSTYRGAIKYDTVDPQWCRMYAMHLREGCAMGCEDDSFKPACALSSIDNHVVLFRNKCALDSANCRSESLQEYEEVDFSICAYHI